jgi:hypothetical protein
MSERFDPIEISNATTGHVERFEMRVAEHGGWVRYTDYADREAELAELRQRLEAAERALADIVNPLAAMKRRAEAEGARLSGMAYQIANDPNHLKEIARSALTPSAGGER